MDDRQFMEELDKAFASAPKEIMNMLKDPEYADEWLNNPEALRDARLALLIKIFLHPAIVLVHHSDFAQMFMQNHSKKRVIASLEDTRYAANLESALSESETALQVRLDKLDSLLKVFRDKCYLNPFHIYQTGFLTVQENCLGEWEEVWRKATGSNRLFLAPLYIQNENDPLHDRFNTGLNHLDRCFNDFKNSIREFRELVSRFMDDGKETLRLKATSGRLWLFGLLALIWTFQYYALKNTFPDGPLFLRILVIIITSSIAIFSLLVIFRGAWRFMIRMQIFRGIRQCESLGNVYSMLLQDGTRLYDKLYRYYRSVCTGSHPSPPDYRHVPGKLQSDMEMLSTSALRVSRRSTLYRRALHASLLGTFAEINDRRNK